MKLATFLSFCFPLGAPHREIHMNNVVNGACYDISAPGANTQIQINVQNLNHTNELPFLVFEYADILKYTNVPNYNEFVNASHSNTGDSAMITYDNGVKFNLLPNKHVRGNSTAEYASVVLEPFESTVVTYDVSKPGVYCVYIPRYKVESERKPSRFQATAQVAGEGFQPYLVASYAEHKNALGLASVLVALVAAFGTTRISKAVLGAVAFRWAVLLLVTMLEGATLRFRCHEYTYWPLEALSKVESILVDGYQDYVLFSVYLGRHVTRDFRYPLMASFFGVVFFTTLVVSMLASDAMKNTAIVEIAGHFYATVFNSILVPSVYQQLDVIRDASLAMLLGVNVLLHVAVAGSLVIYGLIRAIRVFRATDQKKQYAVSLVVHFVLFKVVLKQFVNPFQAPYVSFWGYFDAAECLHKLGGIYAGQHFKQVYVMNFVEVGLFWGVWGWGEKRKIKKA